MPFLGKGKYSRKGRGGEEGNERHGNDKEGKGGQKTPPPLGNTLLIMALILIR